MKALGAALYIILINLNAYNITRKERSDRAERGKKTVLNFSGFHENCGSERFSVLVCFLPSHGDAPVWSSEEKISCFYLNKQTSQAAIV